MAHFTGSRDTAAKLGVLKKYLKAYSIALQSKGFARIYIDAFAGSGIRAEKLSAMPLFDGVDAGPVEVHTSGSARIALDIVPEFDTLVMVEKDPERYALLEALRDAYPDRKIKPHHGDANEAVQRICQRVPWHKRVGEMRGMRGVIFLDPYGMEVTWSTVEAIARTRALDCWYFFPLAGLYRNAPHDLSKLDPVKEAVLDRVLGSPDWRNHWYRRVPAERSLFEDSVEATRRASVDAMEAYVHSRLASVFEGTVLPPMRLRFDGGAPLASLFFAVANPNRTAVKLATDIASHILRAGSSSQVWPR
jgi:three-Cys-motif partner protein